MQACFFFFFFVTAGVFIKTAQFSFFQHYIGVMEGNVRKFLFFVCRNVGTFAFGGIIYLSDLFMVNVNASEHDETGAQYGSWCSNKQVLWALCPSCFLSELLKRTWF